MAKNVVFPYLLYTKFIDEPIIKRLALFFDSIYISEPRINQILKINPNTLNEKFKSITYEKATWEFLIENSIVKIYPYFENKFENIEGNEEGAYTLNKLKSIISQIDLFKNPKEEAEKDSSVSSLNSLKIFYVTHDILVRLDAMQLRKNISSEFYPLLRTRDSFEIQEKKSSVIQFLLNDIPEPEMNTPWEQIIDFRNDEDVKNKYLALINWINKVASSQSSLSDIREEYEYLYNDYIKYFKLHKLKYNNTWLEIIITAGAGLLMAMQAGQFIGYFKNLLQMNLLNIKLIEEEAKLPGKEVAYIYHAKDKFSIH